MAQFIYTISDSVQGIQHPHPACSADHTDLSREFTKLPDNITHPDDAKQYIEENILRKHSGATVTLFMGVEKWVPTTHKRKPRREQE